MIERDTHAAAARDYDLIVVGGGVYGARLLLEASQRGLRALLIEEHDFASSGSWNAPRLIQGALAGIAQRSVPMAVAAAREQQWLCRMFPHLVKPLPCLKPLYISSASRRILTTAAHRLNDALAAAPVRRWRGRHAPPKSRMLSVLQTVALCPDVELRHLQGGLLWYEAAARSVPRLVIEMIREACDHGATALNYCSMSQLLTRNDRACGVLAHDRIEGDSLKLQSPRIALCRGSQFECDQTMVHDSSVPPAPAASGCAMMVLLDRPPLSEATLVVNSPDGTGRQYTLQPCHNLILAGKKCIAHHEAGECHRPSHNDVDRFLDELNDAVPNLSVSHDDVLRLYWHSISAGDEARTLTSWPLIRAGGSMQHGVVDVSGTMLNTSGWAARRALRVLFGRRVGATARTSGPAHCRDAIDLYNPEDLFEGNPGRVSNAILDVIRTESVQCLDDLLLRRTDWLADPRRARSVRERLSQVVDTQTVFSSHPALVEPRAVTRQNLGMRP